MTTEAATSRPLLSFNDRISHILSDRRTHEGDEETRARTNDAIPVVDFIPFPVPSDSIIAPAPEAIGEPESAVGVGVNKSDSRSSDEYVVHDPSIDPFVKNRPTGYPKKQNP